MTLFKQNQLRQDAPMGSLLPTILTTSTNFNGSIPLFNQTLSWDVLPEGWDGFSLLVDDVERFAGTALTFSLAAFEPTIPHFFRLAVRYHVDVFSLKLILFSVHFRGRDWRFYDACNLLAEWDMDGPSPRTLVIISG